MGGYLPGGLRMARPAKLNCDYFPHFVKNERDLDYLIDRFGIEGYYFFYRLREFLCDCDNWYFKVNTDRDMVYLCKQFALDKTRVIELMDICAENSIIDHDLWIKVQIIWQDELASCLQDAWRGRKAHPPGKPILDIEVKLANNGVSNTINPISSPINTQRKGKDNERIVDDSKTKQNKSNKRKEDANSSKSEFKPNKTLAELQKQLEDHYGCD